jgi:hypothetical protein
VIPTNDFDRRPVPDSGPTVADDGELDGFITSLGPITIVAVQGTAAYPAVGATAHLVWSAPTTPAQLVRTLQDLVDQYGLAGVTNVLTNEVRP